MGKKYTKEMHEAYRKEQDKKAAKEAQEQRERVEKESARRAWMADNGKEADFEKAWPELRNSEREGLALDAARHAQEAQRASRISTI